MSEDSPYVVDEKEPAAISKFNFSWLKSRTGKIVAMVASAVVLFGLTAVASFAGSNLTNSNHSSSELKPGGGFGGPTGTQVSPFGYEPNLVVPNFGKEHMGPRPGYKFENHDGPSFGDHRDGRHGQGPRFNPNLPPKFTPST